MNIFSIVPARSGSKGIPNKNIKPLNGIPLFMHSVNISNKIDKIKKCIFTTDSTEYANLITNKEANVVIRPKFLSDDASEDIDYLLHCVYTINEISIDDLLILLRPTTPCRDVETIEIAIEEFIKNINDYDSLRSAHELNEPPPKMMKIKNNILLPYIDGMTPEDANKPRQSFDKAYHPNGYIDIIKVKTLIKNKQVYGNRMYGFITKKVTEIDYIEDFNYLSKE